MFREEYGEEVDEAAVGGVNLLPDEEPMIGKNLRAGDDHFFQELFGRELGRSERSGAPADGPDGVFDGHFSKSMARGLLDGDG